MPRLRRAWLYAAMIGVLSVAFCNGCAGTKDRLKDDAGRTVNLSELIMVRSYALNPQSGMCNKDVTLFYNRRTGGAVAGIDMVMEADFSEGLAVAKQRSEGPLGYVDVTGRMVIPFRYFSAEPFREGRAIVSLEGEDGTLKDGLIDRAGRWIVPAGRYEELDLSGEGRCAFRIGKLWGILDANGRQVVPPRFLAPPSFHSGLAAVRDEQGRTAYIDRYGQVRVNVPERTTTIWNFHDGVALLNVRVSPKIDNIFSEEPYVWKFMYISVAGNVVVPPIYAQASDFSEGLAAVSQNAEVLFQDDMDPMEYAFSTGEKDLWGYIDTAGKVTIPFQFNRAGRFSCGVARVRQNGKWGYIDKSGQFIIPPRYSWARNFRRGIAEVWLNGTIVFIDRTGKVIVDTGLPAVTF